MWVDFNDMHSGGGLKEPPFENIYLEIPMESKTLEQATGYYRGCEYYYVNEKGDQLNWEDWQALSDRDREAYKGQYVEESIVYGGYCFNHSTLEEYRQRENVLILTWPMILVRSATAEGKPW